MSNIDNIKTINNNSLIGTGNINTTTARNKPNFYYTSSDPFTFYNMYDQPLLSFKTDSTNPNSITWKMRLLVKGHVLYNSQQYTQTQTISGFRSYDASNSWVLISDTTAGKTYNNCSIVLNTPDNNTMSSPYIYLPLCSNNGDIYCVTPDTLFYFSKTPADQIETINNEENI